MIALGALTFTFTMSDIINGLGSQKVDMQHNLGRGLCNATQALVVLKFHH